MTNCSHCRQRKAKRRCPALGSDLCPLCCGILREKELHCPPGCRFLTLHKPYQESKIIQKKRKPAEEAPLDERLAWLALTIEASLHEYAGRNPSFSDREAILALEYAREKMEKGRSRLLLTRDERGVRNEAGEAVLMNLDQARFERKIVLPQDIERYSTEEKLRSLENIIQGIQQAARADLAGRAYLQDLGRRLEKLRELSDQKKIVSRP